MRKELILAIFLGGFIGIAVAFGAWRFASSFNGTNSNGESPPPSEEQISGLQQVIGNQDDTSNSTEGLTIVRPRNNAVVNNDSVQVAGITKPNSHVLIVAEEDYVLKTSDGNFEQDIEIAGGINHLPIYVFSENGESVSASTLIINSSEVENAESANAIMGTITDITETYIQIRMPNGEISQVIVSDSTSYVSNVGTPRSISFADLAIGDYVATIGTKSGTGDFNSQRVIVSSPLEESTDVIAYGTVQTLSRNDFIVKNESTGKEWSIDATDSPTVTALNGEGEIATAKLTTVAEEGDWIIIVGEMEDDELIARRIHVL